MSDIKELNEEDLEKVIGGITREKIISPYKCDICGIEFADNHEFEQHMSNYHPERFL